jgi:hypothetical protein
MKEQIHLTLYLDNRRKKSEGAYPAKLRLFINLEQRKNVCLGLG